mgnify:CR=1 FL=1
MEPSSIKSTGAAVWQRRNLTQEPFVSSLLTIWTLAPVKRGNKEKQKHDEVYAHGLTVDEGVSGAGSGIILGWEMASGPNGHNAGGYGNLGRKYTSNKV